MPEMDRDTESRPLEVTSVVGGQVAVLVTAAAAAGAAASPVAPVAWPRRPLLGRLLPRHWGVAVLMLSPGLTVALEESEVVKPARVTEDKSTPRMEDASHLKAKAPAGVRAVRGKPSLAREE